MNPQTMKASCEIFERHEPASIFEYDHDVIWGSHLPDPLSHSVTTKHEVHDLEELGWHWSDDNGCWEAF